jgi:predicted regulator of Ras-like GTPase activity (Roadblock/LC7/MglB family)
MPDDKPRPEPAPAGAGGGSRRPPPKVAIGLADSRYNEMLRHLRALRMNAPDIEEAAVVTVDGLLMVSTFSADYEEQRIAAMSAAMLSLGERIAGELRRGQLDQVFVRGEHGYVLLMSIGEEAVLMALANSRAKLGLIFLEMKRTSNELVHLV